MTAITLLDYEVFEALRAHIGPVTGKREAAFSESVLGYGFRIGAEGPASATFVLLCSPQATDGLEQWLTRALPSGVFPIHGVELPVAVSAAIAPYELQHLLEIASTDQPEPAKGAPGDHLTEWVQVSLGQTLRQVVLNEHRKIILPAYLLRYTPFTSPNLIILRAALSQIHYLHQSGSAANDEFEQRTVSARMTEISRWSSLSRTSIYRLLYEDPRSRWLVDVENKSAYQNDQGQHISQPNQYLLQPLQLTPGDASDLLTYLGAHQPEWQTLDDCLIALAKTDPRKILAYPYRLPQEGDLPQPASVLSLIQQHYGPFELNAERLALLDKVRENLIGRDFITLPWYVLRSLLPVYGASIITLFMMCQPLLFRQGGVQRNTFWLPGGGETLAAWTNDRSIAKYFPKTNAKGRGRPATQKGSTDSQWRKSKREMLADFFLRVETRKDKQGVPQWQIRVNEPPVLSDDERLIATLYELLAQLVRNDRIDPLLTLFERDVFTQPQYQDSSILDRLYRVKLSPAETNLLSMVAEHLFSDFETSDSLLISDFETPEARLISLFEPPVQALISESATPAGALFSNLETYLKILVRIKDSIQIIKNANLPPDSEPASRQEIKSGAEDWDYNQILQSVNPTYRKLILDDPEQRTQFIAWLIRNSLNARVSQPLNLAISQTLQGDSKPDAAALRLAAHSPSVLISVLEQMRIDPARLSFQQDPGLRAIVVDFQQMLMGEDSQNRSVLIQRLVDLLGNGPGTG